MKIGQNSTRNPMVPSDLAYHAWFKSCGSFFKMCPKVLWQAKPLDSMPGWKLVMSLVPGWCELAHQCSARTWHSASSSVSVNTSCKISLELVVPVLVPACRIGLLEARLPKYHISTARAKRSGASAWAWAHALSMVTWHHQNIVNGYHLIMFTHLFKPLLVRVWIPREYLKIPKREKMCPKLDRNVPKVS